MVEATAEDEPFLYQVYASTRREEVAGWGWEEAAQDAFLRMQFDLQQRSYQMEYPNAIHQIVLHGSNRAGRMIVDYRKEAILLVDLSLLPEYRNVGIGTTLLKELQQEAADSGKVLLLQVYHANPALRLYTRLGFEVTAQNGLYVSMRWHTNPTESHSHYIT
ncbi:GNAT family N-acetyltransferase [Brevibacillus humidisoli]|uniref:GNAT family N-acetyltransferase n=1 Tax=Brevibacillus humidisoli TaxID=2895522 RepID=UPI001E47B9C3|nr:GNAT family N-acetyltransferase [Brevibacillus humidisoli]UFJ43345.1 GNAT family N-acetyltransferase [Brevibacillus humidisoli]